MAVRLAAVAMCVLAVVSVACPAWAGDTLNLIIMAAQDPKKEGAMYDTLARYLAANSARVDKINLRVAKNYPEAVQLFQSGTADGIFAGSFVAAILIKKGLVKPVARPVTPAGVSTYKALVVAKEGTKPFAGLDDWKGRKVAYSALASSGEIFARTLLPAGEAPDKFFTQLIAPSHQAALNAVQAGQADYAVVKNTIWDPAKYPGLAVVGGDSEENPDRTLVLGTGAYADYGEELKGILVKLGKDGSEKAVAIKTAFGCAGFIPTGADDFRHTFVIIDKAHINPASFNFSF
jgi:ABC-type phosphate/phosphonate transport system substrate-binding protein